MELPKKYKPEEREPYWQEYWEKNKIYSFDAESDREIFSIDTPPPTVSGKMHMGHAFGNSQQDFIARYKRMKGYNVLQPFGTDDNGLPTQMLIEKLKGVRANKMPRKEFRKLCLETLEKELRPNYISDWKRLGISCDFDVNYTTINEHSQRISQKSFIDLYKKGREYRMETAAMYCPKCHTAISQVELVDMEKDSFFNDIVFKVEKRGIEENDIDDSEKEEEIIIATTRPELLPACVAVFYNPNDERYKHLKGKKAKVPIFGHEVPILEDERADPEKGTGIVMCCTFGDAVDAEWQKAYNLPIREAIDRNGRMTKLAGKYEGMKIDEARKAIIEDMKKESLLLSQKPIKHVVNVHERCNTPIEFIHSKQWFIKYLDLKDEMLKWGEEFEWFPKHMKNRYDNWVKGLQWDWCISRQIYFGIPFPVWYCKDCGEVILAEEKDLPVDPVEDKPPVDKCPKCGSSEFIPETDIINTWATSSLTPTIVKELFSGKAVYDKLKNRPMSLRPQGHDIISFWLFNTVVKSHLHYNMKPWEKAFINGWMLDPKGKKMSKSKGNIIEPQEMIKKYSADALRYMSAGCKLGEDFPFQEKELVAGTKTITKIFNASKFAIMNLDGYKPHIKPGKLEAIDKWMLSAFGRVVESSSENFEKFEYAKVKQEIDNFFWHTFCDNYLETVKGRLYNPDVYGEEKKLSAQYTLYRVLLGILKIYAPFMPFITEEVYHMYFKEYEKEKSIHLTKWPEKEEFLHFDEEFHKLGVLFNNILSDVRKYKSSKNMSLKTEIEKAKIYTMLEGFEEFIDDLKSATKIKNIEIENGEYRIEI